MTPGDAMTDSAIRDVSKARQKSPKKATIF
jgi:hypothetical protein